MVEICYILLLAAQTLLAFNVTHHSFSYVHYISVQLQSSVQHHSITWLYYISKMAGLSIFPLYCSRTGYTSSWRNSVTWNIFICQVWIIQALENMLKKTFRFHTGLEISWPANQLLVSEERFCSMRFLKSLSGNSLPLMELEGLLPCSHCLLNPVHTLAFHFCRHVFNTILPFTPRFSKWSLVFRTCVIVL